MMSLRCRKTSLSLRGSATLRASRDIAAGQNAGMATIAAAYGYITPDDDAAAWGADIIARDTEELAQLVLKAVNLGP